jgi:hypothetical protein
VCGASGNPVSHDQFRKGTAKCLSSLHGKPEIKPSTSSTGEVRSRSDGWDEFYSEKLSAPPPPEQPKVDLAEEQRKANRAAEKKLRSEIMRKKYRQYYNYAVTHGWPLDKVWHFDDFSAICDLDGFLAKQASGYYDPAQGEK